MTGATFGFLGFSLFLLGLNTGESDLDAGGFGMKFGLSRVSPGLIMMACGTLIILGSLRDPYASLGNPSQESEEQTREAPHTETTLDDDPVLDDSGREG
jgi:hypothetical protein